MQKGQLKGQTHTVGTQHAVGISAKMSTERSNPHSGVCSGYTVRSRYAVCVSAKRSTGTVDLANMGGGDHYLWCKKVKPTQWGTQWVHCTQ